MATATRPRTTSRSRTTEGRSDRTTAVAAKVSVVEGNTPTEASTLARLSPFHYASRVPAIERFLKREEADVILVAGNLLLVALEVIEWPVAALTLAVHALARSRYKTLEVIAVVAEEIE